MPQPEPGRDPQIIWPLVIGLAVLIAAAIAAVIIIERRRDRRGRRTPEQLEELGRALDEAIDDLRRDPDPRRAVIAAYARMEQALTLYGFPRRPSEAPYEYLHRVARDLEAEQPVACAHGALRGGEVLGALGRRDDAGTGDRRAHRRATKRYGRGDMRQVVISTSGYAVIGG